MLFLKREQANNTFVEFDQEEMLGWVLGSVPLSPAVCALLVNSGLSLKTRG